MPPACRCMYGGTCYIDESGLPKCKWVVCYGSLGSDYVRLVMHSQFKAFKCAGTASVNIMLWQ